MSRFSGKTPTTVDVECLRADGWARPVRRADCPPFKPEDLDEGCNVGLQDLLIVLSEWGPCK